jgi:hypothetical protein
MHIAEYLCVLLILKLPLHTLVYKRLFYYVSFSGLGPALKEAEEPPILKALLPALLAGRVEAA